MDIRKFCLVAVVAFGTSFSGVAATGDCYKNAASISIGSTKTVKLVDEKNLDYDPEFDDDKTLGTGGYYLKFTAVRGKAYTVTVKRTSADSEILTDILDKSNWDWEAEISWPGFSGEVDPDGLTERYFLLEEDWSLPDPEFDDPGDDKSVTCYIAVTDGYIGEEVTVSVLNGTVEYKPPAGSEENPVSITVSSSEKTSSGKLVDNAEFYFTTQALSKGKKYKFWTSGGTDDAMLSLYVAGTEGVEDPDEFPLESNEVGGNDDGVVVLVNQKGAHQVAVIGDSYGQPFTLHYQLVPARKPSAHDAQDLSTPGAAGVEADCNPGRRNEPASGYFDNIIDSALYRVSLKKGKYYSFETSGATAALIMELYDSSGNVILSNKRGFAEGCDCKIVFEAPKDATYWVGVCQQLEDDEKSELASTSCQFIARRVSEGVSDNWDSADDVRAGATVLAPAITSNWKKDDGHGPHTFGALDWKDVYALNCRKGLTYKIGAICTDEKYAQALTLSARIYKGSSDEPVVTIANLAEGGNFKADANSVYYVEVFVADGQGVDFCEHTIHAAVSGADGLGTLTVDFGGATVADGAAWYFTAEKVNYLPGAIVVPAGDGYKVSFTNVDGWTRPKGQSDISVPADGRTEIFKKYSDEYDASNLAEDATLGDGHYNGEKATTLTPKTSEQSLSRSLWMEDAQDWFRFKTVANAHYTISLADGNRLGDATITLLAKNAASGKLEEIGGGREITILSKTAGVWWRPVVEHANPDEPQDSQYTMTYSYIQVGAVGFEESAKSVKDSSSAAKLTVARTGGKSGRVRVRYRTQSGTDYDAAKPGEHYLPTNGYLVWEDGDDEPKTISVPLLPQLRPEWDETRSFTVELAVLAPEELDDGELVPVVSTSVSEVTITPANKMACGVIGFMGYGEEGDVAKFSGTPKCSVPADESMVVWVSRVGGKDGSVAAVVTTRDSSAKADVDYEPFEETLVWEDGDDAPKPVVLNTLYDGDAETYQAVRKMTLRLAVDEGAQYEAKLDAEAAKVTVSIVDPNATGTFADYQSACKSMSGISVSADGEWYFDAFGDLRNVTPAYKDTSTLTFTVEGPGRFAFLPEFSDGGDPKNVAKCKVDAESWVAIGDERFERYFEAGEHTVTVRVWRKTEDTDGEVSLALMPEDDGLPVLWKPLRAPAIVAPLKGEIVSCDSMLHWQGIDDGEIGYRLSLATSKTRLDNESKAILFNEEAESFDCFELENCELEAGKTYYWRVDAVMVDDGGEVILVDKGTVNSFKTAALGGEGVPLSLLFSESAIEKYGIAEPEEAGLPYEADLIVGVTANVELATENASSGAKFTYELVDAENYPLPPGLSLSKKGAIVRYPTKTGKYTTILKVTEDVNGKKTVGETLKVTFNVKKLSLGAGTFNGLVSTEDDRIVGQTQDGLAASTFASLKVTVDSSPYEYGNSKSKNNIAATFSIGGTSHKFTAKSWSETVELENGQPGVRLDLEEEEKIVYNGGKKTKVVTNRLELTACAGASGDWAALDTPMSAKLTLSVPRIDGKTVVTNAVWEGFAMRNNSSGSLVKPELAKFEGYYTVALKPDDVEDGDATGVEGYGFVTLTVDDKGGVKYVTFLPDASVDHDAEDKSRSATAVYVSPEASGVDGGELLVPIYYGKSTWAFGGWLRLRYDSEQGLPVVSDNQDGEVCSMPLRWVNAVSATTYAGEGYSLHLAPVGGFYDTVVNLQRYYYDLGFNTFIPSENFLQFSEYLASAFGDEEYMLAYPGMKEDGSDEQVDLTLAKNKFEVDARELVYRDNKMIEWFKSINPCNVKISNSRATGIYSGSFQLFSGNDDPGFESVKTRIATPNFKGVLLFSRDPETAVIDPEVVAPGAIYAEVKTDEEKPRTVKVTTPIEIRTAEMEKPWTEESWQEDYPEVEE